MFQGLLKSRFFNKCKTDLRMIRTRIEMIKKRRNAVQKYLRNDIVDLLKDGCDINAYERVEGLIVEMERSNCYDLIDQYCQHLLTNLVALDKQREACPEECREAVSSLMYAAARFADLPELRQLRKLFSDRYGGSLDYYLGKELAEKTKSSLPSKDAKLRLLQEIAAESRLEWSSKALENKLFNESTKMKEINDRNHEYQELDCPIKDIPVDTIVRVAAVHNEPDSLKDVHEDKVLKYGSIPPPYTKCEAKKPTRAKLSEFNDDNVEPVKKVNGLVKSVRTRRNKPQPDKTSPGGSESDKENKEPQSRKLLRAFYQGKFDEHDSKEGMDDLPRYYGRASSIPAESSSSAEESTKHARSMSCQSDVEQGGRGHVHPRLPDYDDIVARLASMKREERG